METVEISALDTRYEGLRLKDKRRERLLYLSILENGILEPLYVIEEPGHHLVLLDGHKRLRGARRCNIHRLPVSVIDDNAATGILRFLRMSVNKGLTQVEQASLVDELHCRHGLSVSEIASRLERSHAWVSLRLGIWKEMGSEVREKIMAGHFPLHNYLYTLKRFKRLKEVSQKSVESFVRTVSNKGLSTRDIDMLAQSYFKGGESLKQQIEHGNIDWTLRQLKQEQKKDALPADTIADNEANILSWMNWIFINMTRINHGLHEDAIKNKAFFTKGKEVADSIMGIRKRFFDSLRYFYDRAG